MRHFSLKRQKQNREYTKLRREYLTKNPFCEARVSVECSGMADDVHHVKKRGANLLEISTFKPVCRMCHIWIHDHPKQAREIGLLQN